MKKQQYIAAIACLVAGAIGFVSVYATDQVQKKRELAQVEQEKQLEEEEKIPVPTSNGDEGDDFKGRNSGKGRANGGRKDTGGRREAGDGTGATESSF